MEKVLEILVKSLCPRVKLQYHNPRIEMKFSSNPEKRPEQIIVHWVVSEGEERNLLEKGYIPEEHLIVDAVDCDHYRLGESIVAPWRRWYAEKGIEKVERT